jgi:hypothetical protein
MLKQARTKVVLLRVFKGLPLGRMIQIIREIYHGLLPLKGIPLQLLPFPNINPRVKEKTLPWS